MSRNTKALWQCFANLRDRMTEVTIRQLVWTMLSLFTLSFWINLSILIEWATLMVENNNADVNRCSQQKDLCRHRYPIIGAITKDYSITAAGPDWNTTAVGDDANSSVSRFSYTVPVIINIKTKLNSPQIWEMPLWRRMRTLRRLLCGRGGRVRYWGQKWSDISMDMFTDDDGEGSLQIWPECKFLLAVLTTHSAHLFLSYLFTLTSFLACGKDGFHSSFAFRFSYTGRCKQTFVEASCVNVFEESRLLAISDPVSLMACILIHKATKHFVNFIGSPKSTQIAKDEIVELLFCRAII